tara:strand:+ start:120 stop:446 length:327 start_codon:yes stop_codon:yes gene_type:complete
MAVARRVAKKTVRAGVKTAKGTKGTVKSTTRSVVKSATRGLKDVSKATKSTAKTISRGAKGAIKSTKAAVKKVGKSKAVRAGLKDLGLTAVGLAPLAMRNARRRRKGR